MWRFCFFFSRHPPRTVTAPLRTVPSGDSETQELKRLIKEVSVHSLRRYRALANRRKKKKKVSVGSLVWVKSETPLAGTWTKLNPKWKGPYRVSESIRDGHMYMIEDPYTGKVLQRAEEKGKPYISRGRSGNSAGLSWGGRGSRPPSTSKKTDWGVLEKGNRTALWWKGCGLKREGVRTECKGM